MDKFMNNLLDRTSEFLGSYPGLLPLLGIFLIGINFVLQSTLGESYWFVANDLFLHVGLIVALLGLLLIRPLR